MNTSGHPGYKGQVTARKAIICGLFLVLVILFEYAGFLIGVNNYFYDLSFRIRGFRPTSEDIIIVNIDDKSLEKLGRWPIGRRYYASLIDKIIDAKVIAFDIIMTEPTEDDTSLARAIRKHRSIILPVIIDNNRNILYPLPSLAGAHTGHVHVEQGIDGVVREIYHTLIINDKILPSLSSLVSSLFSNKPFPRRYDKDKYPSQDIIIQSDHAYINFSGGPGSFKTVSFVDVLNGMYPAGFFRNRIVFVGVNAQGTGDLILTPFSEDRKNMAGVEGQANALNTILMNNPINVVPHLSRWLITAFIAAISLLCFLRLTEQRAAILALMLMLSVAVISYLLFSLLNIWLAPSVIFITIFLIFVLAYIFKFNDAVASLDEAYMTVVPHLRWGYEVNRDKHIKKGLFGSVTEKGIQQKAQILNDISTQLGFEKELTDRALLSDIHGVLIFGHDNKNMLINNLAEGLLKENEIETNSMQTLIESLSGAAIEKINAQDMIERLSSEKDGISFTVSFEKPAKKFYKVDASCFSINERKYTLFILSDVTRIKELEILKGHIISVVSHELKTPLTSIQGFSEILAGKLEGKMKNFADIIHRESERLARFLNMFLDITRIEEGRQPIRMTSVNLNDVVREVALALKPIGDKNGITIHTDIPDKTDNITVDMDLTKQCIYNLVENAIKYSPSGKDVIIRLTDTSKHLAIDIIDNGYGIKEEDIKRVFEKFFRSSSDKTKNIKGSGLGLTFVKDAVEAQGGKLTLTSVYGEGSTFSIIFPK